jgi:hypothetical protein
MGWMTPIPGSDASSVSQLDLEPTQNSIRWVSEALYLCEKWKKREVEHLHTSI